MSDPKQPQETDVLETAEQATDITDAAPEVEQAQDAEEILEEEIAIDVDTQQQTELEDARLGQDDTLDEEAEKAAANAAKDKKKEEHKLTDEKDNPNTPAELPQIIEAALMAYGSTLKIESLQDLFEEHEEPSRNQVKRAIAQVQEDLAERGIELKEVSSGYRLQVKQTYSKWVSRLWEEKPQRYSRALMETMALIAYRQPITRGDIEDVRGVVVSSQTIRTLLDREWIKVVGHRDVPGRPSMYATTKEFLDYFNLKTLEELPSLAEIKEMDDANRDLELERERKASATREYDFNNEEEVEARGQDVLAETEEDLAEAEQLIQQVEDNVFNKPEEPEEEELESEAETEFASDNVSDSTSEQTSLASIANRFVDKDEAMAAYRDKSAGLSDMANKLAERLEQSEEESPVEEAAATETDEERESRELREEQERLMQRLMQEAQQEQREQAEEPETEQIEAAQTTEDEPSRSVSSLFDESPSVENDDESAESSESTMLEVDETEEERLAREELEMIERERAAEQALLDEEQDNEY